MTHLTLLPDQQHDNYNQESRRTFLKGIGKLGVATAIAPSLLLFSKKLHLPAETTVLQPYDASDLALTLYNTHTGESLKEHVFWAEGKYIEEQIKVLVHFFRDHRNGETHAIDPDLLKLLTSIAEKVDSNQPIHLISGYRSPKTNNMLCDKSRGVAKNSQHLYGRAADIMIPDRSMKQVQDAAKSLKVGGVGRYSNFVHVDTGRVRYWGMA